MNLLTIIADEPGVDEDGKEYAKPGMQEWVIGIDRDSTPFILSPPDIHWSFFENGYAAEDVCLRGIPEDIDAGVYKMTFSFWLIPYDGYEQEGEHGFEYVSHSLLLETI